MAGNTDYIVETIVDGIIDSMKPQFDGKVSADVVKTIRSGAILAGTTAIPVPVKFGINSVPRSKIEQALKFVQDKTNGALATETTSTATGVVEKCVNAITAPVMDFIKAQIPTANTAPAFQELPQEPQDAESPPVLEPESPSAEPEAPPIEPEMIAPSQTSVPVPPIDTPSEQTYSLSESEPAPSPSPPVSPSAVAPAPLIRLRCPNPECGSILAAKEKHAGRKKKCPTCQTSITIPSLDAAASYPSDSDSASLVESSVLIKPRFKNFGDALKKGTVDDVKPFIEKKGGYDVNAKGKDGYTPVHYATENESVDVLQYLISKGGDVHATNDKGRTPIFTAALYGNVPAMQCLKDHGAEVNLQDADGHTPMSWAKHLKKDGAVAWLHANGVVSKSPVTVALESNSQGVNTITIDMSTVTILWVMFGASCFLAIAGLLIWTVMTWVALPVAIITLILAIIEPRRIKGQSLKEIAQHDPNNLVAQYELGVWYMRYRSWESAKQCLEKAVALGYVDTNGVLAKCTDAEYWEKYQSRFTNIFEAAGQGTVEDVRYFLQQKGGVLRSFESTRRSFEQRGQFEWLQQILHSSENVLLFIGEKSGLNINRKGTKGNTLLHYAAQSNPDIEVLQYLISIGANVNAKNSNRQTPLDVADTSAKERILQEAGGKPGPLQIPDPAQYVASVVAASSPVKLGSNKKGCYYHPSQDTATRCAKCRKRICRNCIEDYGVSIGEYAGDALCYDCTTELVAKNVTFIDMFRKDVHKERQWMIAGGVLGAILLSFIAIGNGADGAGAILALFFGAAIGGSVGTIITSMFAVGDIGEGIARNIFGANQDNAGATGCVFGLIALAFMCMVAPIVTIYRFSKRSNQINQFDEIISSDALALRQMRDYFAYTLAMEQSAGRGVDLALLASQDGELFDNSYAKSVLANGEQAARAQLRSSVVRIAENGEIIRSAA